MKILAVDTTSFGMTMALSRDGDRPFEIASSERNQDEALWPELRKLLKRAKVALKNIDAFVAASGPGRFTGIRVGMTFASMLAKSLGKKAVAVSHFEAAAWAAREGRGKFYVDFRDRRGEHYIQIFKTGPKGTSILGAPRWVPGHSLRRALMELEKGEGRMPGYRFDGFGFGAAALLPAALRKLQDKDLGEFLPLYVKPAHYQKAKRG